MTIRPPGRFARFAFHRGRITQRPDHLVVKPKLFEPDNNLELSVSNVHELDCVGIRDEGKSVGKRRNDAEYLRGWAEIEHKIVEVANLRLVCDNDPERHANIVGWSTCTREQKRQQTFLAKRVCCAVKLDPPVPVKAET